MRLIFKENKQRGLLKEEKDARKLTWKELSNYLCLDKGRLISYFYEECALPKDIFNKLNLRNKYRKFILREEEDNWGQIKGGKVSKGNTKEIKLPKNSRRLAEFYGIMLGDGNLTKIKGHKRGTYSIRIVGDSRNDKKYLTRYVKPMIKELFDITPRVGKFKDSNAVFIEAVSKKLVEFLEQKEFKPGDKIRNVVGIPSWIKKNPRFLKSCLRGLYDTDGSFYRLANQNSHQINFSNRNSRLLNEVRDSLILLGIFPSNITKGKEINITKKSELRKFIKLIGFSNPKHLNKIDAERIAPSSSGQILSA